jgi:hypothetical protein
VKVTRRMEPGRRGYDPIWWRLALVALGAGTLAAGDDLHINIRDWRIIPSESGSVNYYTAIDDPVLPHVHADYRPGYKTAVLGIEIPRGEEHAFHRLTWTWRAEVLPRDGNECAQGAADSAAVVYVTWKRGLRWYTLKYVWSAVGAKGSVCDRRRNLFVAQDTIILETNGPLQTWRTESIDLDAEFRTHFGSSDLPNLHGLGLMTDGDQTQSQSAADYGGFVLSR